MSNNDEFYPGLHEDYSLPSIDALEDDLERLRGFKTELIELIGRVKRHVRKDAFDDYAISVEELFDDLTGDAVKTIICKSDLAGYGLTADWPESIQYKEWRRAFDAKNKAMIATYRQNHEALKTTGDDFVEALNKCTVAGTGTIGFASGNGACQTRDFAESTVLPFPTTDIEGFAV